MNSNEHPAAIDGKPLVKGWLAFKEQKPVHSQPCVIWKGGYVIASYDEVKGFCISRKDERYTTAKYWCPLPTIL